MIDMDILINIDDGRYIFQSDGKIYSKKYKKYIGSITNAGYMEVSLYNKDRKIKGLLHRILYEKFFNKIPENYLVDHINHNRLDNNINNLRIVTHSENMKNLSKYKNNISGHTGVSYSKNSKKWAVDFPNYKQKSFISLFSAVIFRKFVEYKEGRFYKIQVFYQYF